MASGLPWQTGLTVILPLLTQRTLDVLLGVLRLWTVVLVASLLGTFIFALAAANTDIFRPDVHEAFGLIGRETMEGGFLTILLRAIFAGWLIALMVWMLPAAEVGRVWIIIIVTYVVGLGRFAHIIAGSVAVMYMAITSGVTWAGYLGGFLLPTLIGNIIGGVSLVAVLNHAQVVAGEGRHQ